LDLVDVVELLWYPVLLGGGIPCCLRVCAGI
jgi:hypothetical protein